MSEPKYDPRFEYGGDKPRFIDPEERAKWIAAREQMCKSQGWKCYYCGDPLDIHFMHMDHKHPKSRGGTDDPANLCMTCRTCNLRKGDLTDWEFLGLPDPNVKPGKLYHTGMRVLHPVFGSGIVIASKIVNGDEEVDIKFDDQPKVKRLAVFFAHLTIAPEVR